MKKITWLTCLALCFSLSVWAGDKNEDSTSENTKEEKPIPEVLDVHERDAEMYLIEITPYYTAFFGDTLNASFFGTGAVLDFRLTPQLSLGADFGWNRIAFDPISNYGSTVTNKNMYVMQGILTINMPAAFLSRKNVIETDFFTTIGGGILRINNSNRGAGFVGGGIKLYTGLGWLGIRIEVRNYFSSLPTPTGNDFTTDMTITVGPTFMIPPRLF